MTPPEVRQAIAAPDVHHRTPEFGDLTRNVVGGLQYVFQTLGPVAIITGSGTAAMEAAIIGCARPAMKAAVAVGGKFGSRWAEVCDAYSIPHIDIEIPWGDAVDADAIRRILHSDPQINLVIVTHCETSTATVCDIESIAAVTRDSSALLAVDCVTSLGALPLKMDAWGIDVAITGSQKALMTPPGLGFVAVGSRALERMRSVKPPSLYLDLRAHLDSMDKWDYPFTPAISLIHGLATALDMIRTETIESIWRRTARLAAATRAAAGALNLKLFSSSPSDSVTAIRVPDGIDESRLRKALLEGHGFRVAGGQGPLKGQIIRISHMGYVDEAETLGVIGAIELALVDQGHRCELGAGLAAGQKALAASI